MIISNHKLVFIMVFGLWTTPLLPGFALSPSAVLAQPSIAALPLDSSFLPAPPYLHLSNGSYLDIPRNDSLKLTVFTLSTWFNGNHSGPGNGFIISKGATGEGETPGNNMNYGIYLNRRSNVMGGFETAEGDDYIVTSQSRYTDDKWHHVGLTYNGSMLTMFIDGKLEAAKTTQGALPDNGGNGPLRIGAKSSDPTRGVFTGLADNIIVLNTPVDLPLNFTSTSQIPGNTKIIDIQGASQIPANTTGRTTNAQSTNLTSGSITQSPPLLLR